MPVHKLIFFLLVLFSPLSYAQMNFCTDDLNQQVVQAGGREKPLYVLANETIKFMTGKSKIEDMSATVAFCKLTLSAFGMPLSFEVPIKVEHVDAKKLLGMNEDETTIGVNALNAKSADLENEISTLKENNSYKKELNKVRSRLLTYRAVVEARAWTVPIEKEGKIDFIPIAEFLTESRVKEASTKTDNPVNYLFHEALQTYQKIKGTDLAIGDVQDRLIVELKKEKREQLQDYINDIRNYDENHVSTYLMDLPDWLKSWMGVQLDKEGVPNLGQVSDYKEKLKKALTDIYNFIINGITWDEWKKYASKYPGGARSQINKLFGTDAPRVIDYLGL